MQLDEVVTQGTDWYQVDPSKIEENGSYPAPEGPVVAHKREGKTLAILNENADAHGIPKPDPETEPWVVAGDNYVAFFESKPDAIEYVNETIRSHALWAV